MKTQMLAVIIAALIVGAIGGAATSMIILGGQEKTENDLILDFYATENAVHVSPHGLRKAMDKGDESFILVDLRSQEEYEEEHIVGAVSIPAYRDPDTSAYDDVDRIVAAFKALPQDKEIIVYCYSIPCMTGRKVGKMLADHGVFVKHLGVGWNEWRYFWTLWNHPHEWNVTNVEDYIVSGSEPGTPHLTENSMSCPIEGEFGC